MAQHSLKESDLIAFDHAAAGHDGVLSDASGDLVIKPCTAAEVAFYEASTAHPDFAAYMPTYMGTLSLSSQSDPAAAAEALTSIVNPEIASVTATSEVVTEGTATTSKPGDPGPAHGKKLDTGLSIVLENVAAGFKKPNILDVKLGARLWDEGAKLEKRAGLDKVAAETTSKSLGFRIAGMKTWQGVAAAEKNSTDKGGYKNFDKMYGRMFTADNVQEAFEEFLFVESAGITESVGKTLVERLLTEIKALEKIVARQESRMVSASILYVYEGDGKALEEALDEERVLLAEKSHSKISGDGDDEEEDDDDEEDVKSKVDAVKLIDFAHASWTPGLGPDENVLQGIRSVIRILQGFLE
ncbi:MAG: hypothetical protein M1812_000721 [Candelaria pacifica]|nr:MAG: hypothetical protein M1812_000721 [Candelaria pacifica]